FFFFFSSRRRHTRFSRDWSSDVCSSDLVRGFLHRKDGPAIIYPDGRKEWWVNGILNKIYDYGVTVWVRNNVIHNSGPAIEYYDRSEERRVGKECRSGWSEDQEKKSRRES